MARVNYKGFPTDPSGNKLSGIDIEVNFQSTGLPADVYAAETGGSPIAQPFQTATDGSFEFWADPDDYTIVAGTGPTQQTLPITLTEPLSEGGTILFGDGSAATPSITNIGDTDTGFFFPADNEIGIATAGVERVRVNGTGNVGIGTTSPDGTLHVHTGSAGAVTAPTVADDVVVEGLGSTGLSILSPDASNATLSFGSPSDNDYFFIQGFYNSGSPFARFTVNGSERMRIDTNGRLLLGGATPTGGERLLVEGASSEIAVNATSGAASIRFREAGTERAKIASLGGPGGLLFESAGSEAMRLTSAGKLGLGTTAPLGKLDVSDGSNPLSFDSSTYNEIQSYNRPLLLNRQGNNVGIGTTSATGKFTVVSGSSDHIRLEGTSGDPYGLWTSAAGTSLTVGSWGNGARINLFDSSELITFGVGAASEERMRIDNSGNVGIGTSSPSRPLEVNGAIRLSNAAVIEWGGTDYSITGDTGGAMILRTAGSEAMRIDSSGNLGLGTSAPNSPLSVRKGASGSTVAELKNAGGFGISVTPQAGGSGSVTEIGLLAGESLSFAPNSTEAMRIDSSGNVGVGTTSPSATLDVVGGSTLLRLYDGTNNATAKVSQSGEVITLSHAGVASGGLAFATGSGSLGTERMRIDSSGNVGVGTTAPSSLLEISGADALASVSATGNSGGQIRFTNTDAPLGFTVGITGATGGDALLYMADSKNMLFYTGASERMRIDSSGNLLVGKTTSSVATQGTAIYSDGRGFFTPDGNYGLFVNRLTSDGSLALFQRDGVVVGSISAAGSTTSYNTSSDARLKDNIQDAGQAGEKIDAIRVVQHDWKADGSHVDFGFIAQELNEVYPDAVTVPDDPEEMQSVDYSKLVPLLLKEIQNLRKRVKELEEE